MVIAPLMSTLEQSKPNVITRQAEEGTALPLVAYGVPKKALASTDSAEPEQAYVTEVSEVHLRKAL